MEENKQAFHSGFVAIVGRPNVGKSTFLNYVVGQKVAIMSDVPQTTRNKIQGIYTTDREQIVFIDTPGIHKAHNKLGDFMVQSAISSLNEVDAVMFMEMRIKNGVPGITTLSNGWRKLRIGQFIWWLIRLT